MVTLKKFLMENIFCACQVNIHLVSTEDTPEGRRFLHVIGIVFVFHLENVFPHRQIHAQSYE